MTTAEQTYSYEPMDYHRTAAKNFYRLYNEAMPAPLRLSSASNCEIDAVLGFAIERIDSLDDDELRNRETDRLAVLLTFLDGARVNEVRSYAATIGYETVGTKEEFIKSAVTEYATLVKQELNMEDSGNFIDHHDLLRLLSDLSESNRMSPYHAQGMAGLLEIAAVNHVDPTQLKMAYRATSSQLQEIIAQRAPRINSQRGLNSFAPGTEHLIYKGVGHLKRLVGYPRDDIRQVSMSRLVRDEAGHFAPPNTPIDDETLRTTRKLVEEKIGYAVEHLYGRVY